MARRALPPDSFRFRTPLRALSPEERSIVEQFHKLYYRLWGFGEERGTIDLHWMGHHLLKCPMDLWTYQEILYETEPDLIIECGTRFGGSALYLASLCDMLGRGRIVSVDIEDVPGRPTHPRVTYLRGSSTDPAVVAQVEAQVSAGERVMVILDSDHARDHVLQELEIYHRLVTRGCYIIVEDSNVNGHPAYPKHGPGPMEAIEAFIESNVAFYIDRDRERFLLSMNPCGFLLRIS